MPIKRAMRLILRTRLRLPTDSLSIPAGDRASGVSNQYLGGITRSGISGSYSYRATPGREKIPVNYVTFYNALRFANWLHNGQCDGGTETGA